MELERDIWRGALVDWIGSMVLAFGGVFWIATLL